MLCSELLAAFEAVLPLGNILTSEQIARNLMNAVRKYCGFATLRNAPSDFEKAQAASIEQGLPPAELPTYGQGVHSPVGTGNVFSGDQDFDLSPSELAIIEPLWRLYVERENAMGMEASRSLGIEQYGRSVAEIESEIAQKEEALPNVAFYEPIVTI